MDAAQLAWWLNLAGLLAGVSGAMVMYWFPAPGTRLTPEGASLDVFSTSPSEDGARRYRRDLVLGRVGALLLGIAFLLQATGAVLAA
jgi:hypothetical protein